tara:strand:- start:2051 stop:2221 length:171 start_codon:yes stop_codon:yes gene_type:complete
MKEKVIIVVFVLFFSVSTNNFLNNVIKNSINNNKSSINIAIADDLWDYFSRFTVNN